LNNASLIFLPFIISLAQLVLPCHLLSSFKKNKCLFSGNNSSIAFTLSSAVFLEAA
jgi:hypothetical protein